MTDVIQLDGVNFIPLDVAARDADLSSDYLYRLSRNGTISSRIIGRRRFVDRESLQAFLVDRAHRLESQRIELSKQRAEEYAHRTGAIPDTGPQRGATSVVSGAAHAGRSGVSGVMHQAPVSSVAAAAVVMGKKAVETTMALADVSSKKGSTVSRVLNQHGAKLVDGMRESMSVSGVSDAALRAGISGVHLPIYNVSPMVEFVHKLVALTLAFMLTFGTYSLVDPQYAKFALASIESNAHQIRASYVALTHGGVTKLASNADAQLAAAAENPAETLALATYTITNAVPQSLAMLAKSVNSSVNGFVYAIAFPEALVRSNVVGSVDIHVTPSSHVAQNTPASNAAGTGSGSGLSTSTASSTGSGSGTGSGAGTPTVIERIVQVASPSPVVVAGGITEEELNARLQQLDNKLSSQIFAITAQGSANTAAISSNYQSIATTQRIDHLSGVAISGGTIEGTSLTNVTISANSITDNGDFTVSGTSNFSTTTVNGDLTLSGSLRFTTSSSTISATTASTTNLLATNATSTNATSTNHYISNLVFENATGTSATSTNLYANNLFSQNLIAFSAPIAPSFTATSTSATSSFAGGFSAASNFYVLQNGNVGIGTTSPAQPLSVNGNAYIAGDLHLSTSTAATANIYFGKDAARLFYNSSDYTLYGGSLYTNAGRIVSIGNSETIGLGVRNVNGDGTYYLGASHSFTPDLIFTNTGLTETARLTDGGFFGIGTSSPFSALAVVGSGYFTSGLTAATGTFTSATSTNFFATNASTTNATSTNLYATSGSFGSLSVGASNSSGLATFGGGLIAQASSTIGNGTQTGGLTISGGATTTGNSYIAGNLTVAGNTTTLGTSTSNLLVVNSAINSNLVPNGNKIFDLGSPSFYWRNGYIDTITVNNISAASTSIGGTASNTFTLNSDNATADTEDMSLIFFRGTVVPNALLSWNSAASAKRFEFNQPLYIANQSGSTTQTTFTLKAVAGQTGNMLDIQNSSGSSLFSIGANGATTVGGSLTVNGSLTTTQQASTTLFSSLGPAYFGTTATTTIDTTGAITVTSGSKNTFPYASSTALTVSGQANLGSLAGAAVSSLSNSYVPKWNSASGIFGQSLIYDNGTQIGIGTNSNLSGAVTANGTFGVQAEGDIFRQYDSGDATWYPIIARYNTANGTYPASTYIFGNGTNARVGFEVPGGGNLTTFQVKSATSWFNGNLGIGTTTPSTNLAVQGNALFSGNVSLASLTATGTVTTANLTSTGLLSLNNASTSQFSVFQKAYFGGTATTTIDSSGNITYTAGAKITPATDSTTALHFTKADGTTDVMRLDSTNANLYVTNDVRVGGAFSNSSATANINLDPANSHDIQFNTGSERLRILNSNGNVGIGTSSPGSKLEVSTGTNEATLIGNQSSNLSSLGLSNLTSGVLFRRASDGSLTNGIFNYGDTGGLPSLGVVGRNDIAFFNNLTQTLTIKNSGNVGIGTSTPSGKLDVYGSVNVGDASTAFSGSNQLNVINSAGASIRFGNASGSGIVGADGGGTTVGSFSNQSLFLKTNNTVRGTFDTSGNFGVGTTSPFATSLTIGTAASGKNLVQDAVAGWRDGLLLARGGTIKAGIGLDSGATALQFFTGGTSLSDGSARVTIGSTGNVGVGTSTIWGKFAVSLNNGDTNTNAFIIASSTASATTTLFSIDNAGNLSATAGAATFASGSGFLSNGTLNLNSHSITNVDTVFGSNAGGTNLTLTTNNSTGNLIFKAGTQSEFARITSTGNFGVGTSSPFAKVSIHAGATDTNTSLFTIASSTASATTTLLQVYNTGELAIGPNSSFNNPFISFANTGVPNVFRAAIGYDSNTSNAFVQSGAGKGIEFNVNQSSVASGGTAMTITSGANVGIGTTTPAATLAVAGTQFIGGTGSGNGDLIITDSNSSDLLLRNTGTNGITWGLRSFANSNTNYFAINQWGTGDRFVINSSGNVGIGTTSPQTRLHVANGFSGTLASANTIATFENSGSGYLSLLVPSNSEEGVLFGNQASNVAGGIIYNNSGTSNGFQFRVNGNSTKVVIDSSGNVGIGTTTPTNPLTLPAGSVGTPSVSFGDTGTGFYRQGSGAVSFASGGVEVARFTSNQLSLSSNNLTNVNGINFTSDGWITRQGDGIWSLTNQAQNDFGRLQLGGTTASFPAIKRNGAGIDFRLADDSGYASIAAANITSSGLFSSVNASTSLLSVFQKSYFGGTATSTFDNAGNLSLVSNGLTVGTSQLVVSGGNVGVGTTTPASTLGVNGGAYFNGNINIAGQQITSDGVGASMRLTAGAGLFLNAGSTKFSVTNGTACESGSLYCFNSSGSVGIGTTSPSFKFEVDSNSEWPIATRFAGSTGSNRGLILSQRAGGTTASPTAVQSGYILGGIDMAGYDGTSWTGGWNGGAEIYAQAAENWTTSAHGADLLFVTTAAGGTASAERMRITQAGNVGIGTTSPGNILTVNGGTNPGSEILGLTTTGSHNPGLGLWDTTDGGWIEFSQGGTFYLASSTNTGTWGGNILTVTKGGNVGIGTTSPATTFSVGGSGYLTGGLGVGLAHNTTGEILTSGNILSNGAVFGAYSAGFGTAFVIGNDTALADINAANTAELYGQSDNTVASLKLGTGGGTISGASGNVGIGTTTPFRALSVTNTVSAAQVAIAYDGTRYTQMQTDASGDFHINPSGQDIQTDDSNVWVCAGGACPSGAPTGTGNLVVENKVAIGTSTPTEMLSVLSADNTNTTNIFAVRANNLTQGVGIGYNAIRALGTNGSNNLFIDAQTTGALLLQTNATGNVGIGTTSPAKSLSVQNTLYVGANGATGMGTATSTFQGDIKITGKLDVGTIDPPYTVDGVKYATYGSSMTGVKEETAQTIELTQKDASGKYAYTIDFDKEEKGSDLWLFYQVTDFGADWQHLTVLLTPSFDGAVFYKKIPGKHELVVYADQPGEVSMRLTGNRYDFTKWGNVRPDQDGNTEGTHVISSKPTISQAAAAAIVNSIR